MSRCTCYYDKSDNLNLPWKEDVKPDIDRAPFGRYVGAEGERPVCYETVEDCPD